MFTGWSIHALDEKGRLAIPARFRELLRDDGGERVVLTTEKNCLVATPYNEWKAFAEQVSLLSKIEPKYQAYRRYVISSAAECLCDKQGRILIPQALRDLAGLNDQIYVVGMQHNFEIWDKDRWFAERAKIEANFDDYSAAVASALKPGE